MGGIVSRITSFTIVSQPFIQTQIKENIKAPRQWPLCAGNSPGTAEFPAQMASNAENVSTCWRHHVMSNKLLCKLYNVPSHYCIFIKNDMTGKRMFGFRYVFRAL